MQTSTIQLKRPETYQPRVEAEQTGLPGSFKNAPFVCVHYPHGWTYHDTHGFIPELSEIVSKPGVNGVTIAGRGPNAKIDNSKAIAGSMKKGGKIIDPRDSRLGEFTDYVVFYPTVDGGKCFCFMGAEFEILPGGHVRQLDTSAIYLAFRVHLRDHGLVEPMSGSVYAKLHDIEQTAINRLSNRAADKPRWMEPLKAREARLPAMEKAWAAYQENPAPKAHGAPVSAKLAIKPSAAKVNIRADGSDNV